MKLRWRIVALITILITTSDLHADQLERDLWRGEFIQISPQSWRGPMELYIRYDPEAELPTQIEGVITWPSVNGARTAISGQMTSPTTFKFSEERCLEGDCSQLILGGEYEAHMISATDLRGTATAPGRLNGEFRLLKK